MFQWLRDLFGPNQPADAEHKRSELDVAGGAFGDPKEIVITLVLRRLPNSGGWVATSPQLQELHEEGASPEELIVRIQYVVAPNLLRARGLIDPNVDQKLTFLTRFEEQS